MRVMIEEAVKSIRGKTSFEPKIGIILGTGLGQLVKSIDEEISIPYKEIPHFAESTVESHTGKLIFGKLSGKSVVAMQGRFHYYEGYSMQEVTFPVRVMKSLGCDLLIVSNACGGVNPLFNHGDVMLICDHINLLPDNPLRGKNDDSLGPRFPDMYNAYDKEIIELAERVALQHGIGVKKGVYVAMSGPCFETFAEYRMVRNIGGDVVGMSTIPEVIVARHSGMKVLGISIVTDLCFPDKPQAVSHAIVIKAANEAEPKLTKLVEEVVREIEI
ncbi:MAG: purine-nucleoside phosphorylase [Candidatus Stahlbacteria bacterium]|nr:purine-nucleoside phosphorylase [Candidatus Stahlbacteria bacterium]